MGVGRKQDQGEAATSAAEAGFRTVTARRRRRETKQRMLEAMFELVDRDGADALTVDELRHACGLSRGAYYRYFPTLQDMLVAASAAIGGRIHAEVSERFDGEPNAARRMCKVARYFVQRAASDAACAQLLLKTMPNTVAVSEYSRMRATANFAQAQADGQFLLPDAEVALELGLGVQVAMLRRAVVHGFDAAKASAAVEVMMRGFGLDPASAHRFANEPLTPPDDTDLRNAAIARMLED